METLLQSDNLTIIVLALWVVDLKLTVKYYREKTTTQWSLLDKVLTSLHAIEKVIGD